MAWRIQRRARNARAEAVAGVLAQHARVAALEIRGDDVGGERREAHRAVEASGGERGDRAGGVADEEAARAGDAAQHAADGNESAAALEGASDAEGQRARETRAAPCAASQPSRR